MNIALGRYIRDAEANALRYELSLSNSHRVIKKALQKLCNHYEAGRKLRDSADHRQLIHSHLWCSDVLLRRWSMKALGLIAHRDDTARLFARLRVESDFEAQTWGAAALLTTSADRSMSDLCAEAGIETSAPFWLAARLYAPSRWINQHWKQTTVSILDDDVTLKWAIFLAGYNKAPVDMFDPRHDNRVFLGELNQHDSPELLEYSVWALWERAEYNFSDLRIPLDKFLSCPDNARKWLYRLMMKSPALSDLSAEKIVEFRRSDQSRSAREGLALGMGDCNDPELQRITLDWYDDEEDAVVKDVLLNSMAAKSNDSADFADIVTRRFKEGPIAGYLRTKLLAAAEGTQLYKVLKRIDLQDEFGKQGLLEFLPAANITFNTEVRNMGSNFTIGRDLNAQNLSGGDMTADAISAVKSLPTNSDQLILKRVLEFLSSNQIPNNERKTVADAVELAAKNPSADSRNGVLTALRALGSSVGTIAGLAEITDFVKDWLS